MQFSSTSSGPTIVTFEHEGQVYEARIALAVMDVEPNGRVLPDGTPDFNIQVNPSTRIVARGPVAEKRPKARRVTKLKAVAGG